MDTSLVIALLRHADYQQPADVPSALLPYPLTEKGILQARRAADELLTYLQDHGLSLIPIIDTSRMLRAWQTATVIADSLSQRMDISIQISEFDDLAERSVGAAANLTTETIESLMADDPRYDAPPEGWKSMSDYRLPFQGAESLVEAGARVAGHIERVQQNCEKDGIAGLKLIIGHGASIRHAAADLGVVKKRNVAGLSMYHASPVYLARAASGWAHVGGTWKVRKSETDSDEIEGR